MSEKYEIKSEWFWLELSKEGHLEVPEWASEYGYDSEEEAVNDFQGQALSGWPQAFLVKRYRKGLVFE